MKKVVPNGSAIKALRLALEKLSTQKEMANEIGVSMRMLRKIENENVPLAPSTAAKLARALGVHREQILEGGVTDYTYAPGKKFVLEVPDFDAVLRKTSEDRKKGLLIPRYDFEYARATKDGVELYKDAHSSHEIECLIEGPLDDATNEYAQELINVLTQQTYPQRRALLNEDPARVISIQRRVRELIVLLRGNDVWIYTNRVFRTLPERDTLPPKDEPKEHISRLMLVFGPAGEYGEDTLKVRVDNGQPTFLPPITDDK